MVCMAGEEREGGVLGRDEGNKLLLKLLEEYIGRIFF